MYHNWCALEYYKLSYEDQSAILLTVLLHDPYNNLIKILKQLGKSSDFIEDVIFIKK